MQPDTKKRVFKSLNGLRGITISSVVLLHFGILVKVLLPETESFFGFTERVKFRMDLFFMLSGFVLSHAYFGRQTFSFAAYKEFLRARLIRAYPGHLAAILILAVGLLVSNSLGLHVGGKYPLEALPLHLTLTQAWPMFTWALPTWNYPTWFLSALWFGWLFVFPLIWFLGPKLRGSTLKVPLIVALIAAWIGLQPAAYSVEFCSVLQVACDLGVGCILYICYQDRNLLIRFSQRNPDKIGVLFALAVASIWFIEAKDVLVWVNRALMFCAPVLLASMTAETGFVSWLMTRRPLTWLGAHSYSLFVSHAIVLKAMKHGLPPAKFVSASLASRSFIFAVYMALVIALAMVFRRYIELPCKEMLSRKRVSEPVQELAPKAVALRSE